MPNVLQFSKPKNGKFLTVDTNILTLVENVCSSGAAVNWPVTGRNGKVFRLVIVEWD
jgi:hypothetical protein